MKMQQIKLFLITFLTVYTLIFTYNRFDLYEVPYSYKDYKTGDKVNYIKRGEAGFNKWFLNEYNKQYQDVIVDNNYGTYVKCDIDFQIQDGSIICNETITPLGDVKNKRLSAGSYIYNGIKFIEINDEDILGVIKNDRIINKH